AAGTRLLVVMSVKEPAETYLYRPVRAAWLVLSRGARRLQSGRLDAYIAYMLVALLTVLVGVTFKSGKTDIVVSGRGLNNGLSATSVPLGTSIEPGTRLETDGLNGALYPAGLPVATVKTVTLTPGAATYNLTLKPVANLRHLSYLDVVLWEPTA
ncbi:MAG: rod shape-determining protein MreC, partial [Acidimicrobiales bacterium]